MAFNFNNVIFNELIATNGTNYHSPTDTELNNGIELDSQLNSEMLNSFLYKSSAAIKQIQENGAITYIPGKIYNEGNIVTCNVVLDNNMFIMVLVCNKDNTNSQPLKEMQTDDNGFVYFNSRELFDDSWSKVFIKQYDEDELLFKDFVGTSTETNKSFKYIKLYDQPIGYNATSTTRITIIRANNVLSANLNINYTNNVCKCYITEVYCNNYSMDSITSIWNEQSIFKDFALMGMFLYLDTTTNTIKLCICPRKSTVNITDEEIKINVKNIKGNIRFSLVDEGNTGTILDQNIKKIPFIDHASTEYRKAFQLFDTFTYLNYEDRFKKGLIICDETVDNNLIVYSCLGTSQSGRYGSKFYNLKDKYTSTIQGQDNISSNDILQQSIDKLEYIEPQFTGVMFEICADACFLNETRYGIPEGVWGTSNGDYYNFPKFYPGSNSTIVDNFYAVANTNLTFFFVGFDASRSSNTFSNDIVNDFYLDSVKVYKYVYFI